MKLKQSEINFIIEKIPKGKFYLDNRNWNDILDELDSLELKIGYADKNFDDVNDTGIYIERLIDKIAYDDGNDDVLEMESD